MEITYTTCLLGHPCGRCAGRGTVRAPRSHGGHLIPCGQCDGSGRAPAGRFGCRFCGES